MLKDVLNYHIVAQAIEGGQASATPTAAVAFEQGYLVFSNFVSKLETDLEELNLNREIAVHKRDAIESDPAQVKLLNLHIAKAQKTFVGQQALAENKLRSGYSVLSQRQITDQVMYDFTRLYESTQRFKDTGVEDDPDYKSAKSNLESYLKRTEPFDSRVKEIDAQIRDLKAKIEWFKSLQATMFADLDA